MAIIRYTRYLEMIEDCHVENIPALQMAIDNWNLPPDARLRELIIAVRAAEAGHRGKNHEYADDIASGRRD